MTGYWNTHVNTLKLKLSALTDKELIFESGTESERQGKSEIRLEKVIQEMAKIVLKEKLSTFEFLLKARSQY